MWLKSMVFCFLFCLLIFYSTMGICGSSYLDINSSPKGAEIYINNKYIGKTPLTGVEVSAGKTRITAKKKGFGEATKTLYLKDNDFINIKIPLSKSSGTYTKEVTFTQDKGKVLIVNQLGNIPVYFNGEKKGVGSISLKDVTTGTHDVKVGQLQKEITVYKNFLTKVLVKKNRIVIKDEKCLQEDAMRFVDNGDGTITDTKYNLMWAAKDSGRGLSLRNAKRYVREHKGGGHRDWRLPSGADLVHLYLLDTCIGKYTSRIQLTGPKILWSTEKWQDGSNLKTMGRGMEDSSCWWFCCKESYSMTWTALPVRNVR